MTASPLARSCTSAAAHDLREGRPALRRAASGHLRFVGAEGAMALRRFALRGALACRPLGAGAVLLASQPSGRFHLSAFVRSTSFVSVKPRLTRTHVLLAPSRVPLAGRPERPRLTDRGLPRRLGGPRAAGPFWAVAILVGQGCLCFVAGFDGKPRSKGAAESDASSLLREMPGRARAHASARRERTRAIAVFRQNPPPRTRFRALCRATAAARSVRLSARGTFQNRLRCEHVRRQPGPPLLIGARHGRIVALPRPVKPPRSIALPDRAA